VSRHRRLSPRRERGVGVADLYVDRSVLFSVVVRVLYTLGQAQIEDFRFAVLRGDQRRSLPIFVPKICGSPWKKGVGAELDLGRPSPCLSTKALLTRRGLGIRMHRTLDSACAGHATAAKGSEDSTVETVPLPCTIVDNGGVFQLDEIHRQFGEEALCRHAMLGAASDTRWDQVVLAIDALRKAGHEDVSLVAPPPSTGRCQLSGGTGPRPAGARRSRPSENRTKSENRTNAGSPAGIVAASR
jgi:biopolymer transport protein ExbD